MSVWPQLPFGGSPPLQLEDLPSDHSPSLSTLPLPPNPPWLFLQCSGRGRPRLVWGRGPRVGGGSKWHLGPDPQLGLVNWIKWVESARLELSGVWVVTVSGHFLHTEVSEAVRDLDLRCLGAYNRTRFLGLWGCDEALFSEKQFFVQWKGGRHSGMRVLVGMSTGKAIQWTAGVWKLKSCCPHPLPESLLLYKGVSPNDPERLGFRFFHLSAVQIRHSGAFF